mgnify:CR=1 FL=1
MGRIFNVQDTAIVEGSGPIVDRTRELLGPSDRAMLLPRAAKSYARSVTSRRDVSASRDPEQGTESLSRSDGRFRSDHRRHRLADSLEETSSPRFAKKQRLTLNLSPDFAGEGSFSRSVLPADLNGLNDLNLNSSLRFPPLSALSSLFNLRANAKSNNLLSRRVAPIDALQQRRHDGFCKSSLRIPSGVSAGLTRS